MRYPGTHERPLSVSTPPPRVIRNKRISDQFGRFVYWRCSSYGTFSKTKVFFFVTNRDFIFSGFSFNRFACRTDGSRSR